MSTVFEFRLSLDVRFAYGIAYILEFGLFAKGNLLRAETEPLIEFNNVLPIQLIDAIAEVPELSRENKMEIKIAQDMAMYAVEA